MNMFFTRREFVRKGLGLVGLTSTVPAFLSRTVYAMTRPLDVPGALPKPGTPKERVLVVLQLAGGNDGINTVIPYRNDAYRRARTRLAIPAKDVLRINDEIGFHPKATGLKQLYDQGLLGIVQGVGYPNPNRSHFVSTDVWSSGDPERKTYTGWVGRYFDNACSGNDVPNPEMGIALTREVPLTMVGSAFSPVTFVSPSELHWQSHRTNEGADKVFAKLNRRPAKREHPRSEPLTTLDFLRRAAFNARMSMDDIRQAAGAATVGPRANLQSHLMMVANMIAAGLPTRVYYVSLTGFDTHANQTGRHQTLLQQLGDALVAFFRQLGQHGLDDRVVVMTFSEFGRRLAENASGGTDHGVAAPQFVVGKHVKPGLHGRYPSLTDLDQGDLKHSVDFRSMYAAVLSDWLGADARKLIPGKYPRLDLIRS